MRRCIILLIILVVFTTVFIRCKEEYAEPEYYWGEATAELNGQYWISKIWGAERNNLIDITLHKFNQANLRRENFFLYKIPPQIGVYKILKTSADSAADTTGIFYNTLEDDGDVILDIYHLNETDSTHFVQITAYNEKTTIVEGTFQVSLIRDATRPKRHPHIADTLRFTNGRFKTKILVNR
jgi:hypothetical protein